MNEDQTPKRSELHNHFNVPPTRTEMHREPENGGQHQRPNRPKRSRRRRLIITIVCLLIIAVGVFAAYKWYAAKKAANSVFNSANIQKARDVSSVIKKNKPISILLLGTDTGALGRNYRGRTDTIIIATLNPKKKSMTLTSIPRDTALSIPGYTQYAPSKLNSAYSFGGAGTSIKSIQQLLDVPIDFYGLINMGGLEKIVNGVGGVTVKPTLTFKYGAANVVKGKKIHLGGKAALDYSRMRDDDPQGDYGRQVRQRQVLMAILRKSDSISTLLSQSFMDSLKKQTQTDLSFNEIVALSTKYRVATHHLKSTHLQGTTQLINGQDFEVTSQTEMQRVTNFIRKGLDLGHKSTGTANLTSVTTGTTADTSQSSYYDSTQTGTDNTTGY
ncbi:LCP family protein [Pediococcus inopinatus]|uniref:LCP family protein n=1 Tax=Pediococcus inopinatus TaxID=114090 RepID=A0ABZ0Q5M8_9LACO|nr:LCP family protein [Pediococcus inopinatus]WPC18684.1 LCP family protein [Pediococcus inopinatus]WPC22298.1 LCP family protein [Pediococcus inopinatus]WPP08767.1 LCP family protein [Pediococcus inopinatus]